MTRRQHLPFVLQVDAVGPAGEIGAVGDAERLVAGNEWRVRIGGVGNQRQGIGLGEAGDALALDEEAAAQRVLGRHLPAGIALHAGGEAGALRPRREAVVQKVADRVGLVVELGIARKARELHVEVGVGLLQRGDAEVGAFPLALVEDRAVPGGIAEHREVRNLVDVVGYLVARAGAAADEGEPRILVDDAGDLGEPIPLRGVVMDRRPCRRRILDADAVADVLADGEVVDVAAAAAILRRRLHPVVRSAHERGLGAGIGRARLDPDVDDACGTQAILRRQRAGEQRERIGEARRQDLAEERQPFRQLHAIEPVLQAAVIAAHMDLAEAVLHHAGRAQQHLVQRRVLALRRVLDGGTAEVVLGGAEARQDGAALLVHLDHRFPRHTEQGEQQGRGEAGAVLAGGAVEDQRPMRAVAQRREQGAETRRAAARIFAIVVGEEVHHEVRRGRAVGHGIPDPVAKLRLYVGADNAAVDTVDQMRRLRRLVDAAQVDDGAHAELAQRRAILVGQGAEMGRAEHGAAAHGAAVRRAIAAEIAEIGAAFQRHDMGKRVIEHAEHLSHPACSDHVV